MSPEQAAGRRDIDTRTDVYSLGVILQELITPSIGRKEQTPGRRARRLNRLSYLQSQELHWITTRCLEPNRSARYQSAESLAADIKRFLTYEPVHACPKSVSYSCAKLARRHRNPIISGLLVLLASAAAGLPGLKAYLEHSSAHRRWVGVVQRSLSDARTAIDARDLTIANQRLGLAKGQIESQRTLRIDFGRELEALSSEVAARQFDAQRFARFSELVRYANYEIDPHEPEAAPFFREALALYRVTDDANWWSRVSLSYLDESQKSLVREEAYEMTVLLAYLAIRKGVPFPPEGSVNPRQTIDLLEKATAFHEPTRIVWFLRWWAYGAVSEHTAAEDAYTRYQSALASTPWDYWIPAHNTPLANGGFEKAISGYHEALRLEPTHVSSLYFLGSRLASRGRQNEAIAYYTGCIAARPNYVWVFHRRAELFESQNRLEEAEADYDAAVQNADDDKLRLEAYLGRSNFFHRKGRLQEACQDYERFAHLLKLVAVRDGTNHPVVLRANKWLTQFAIQAAD